MNVYFERSQHIFEFAKTITPTLPIVSVETIYTYLHFPLVDP